MKAIFSNSLFGSGSIPVSRGPFIWAIALFSAIAVQADFKYGADVSAVPVYEEAGAVYRNRQGNAGDALEILRDEGVNLYRLRLFVNPRGVGFVVNDLPYTINLAKRVKELGVELLLNIHYSDRWASPGHQIIPKAWKGDDVDALVDRVEEYSFSVIQSFVEAGIVPEYVQIGNEITGGMLRPIGSLRAQEGGSEKDRWNRLARLLNAGLRGCRDALPGEATTRFMLHVESPHMKDRILRWYRNAIDQGIDFDIIGMSYYPHWHRDIAGLKGTLEALALEFDQDIMLVETGYPYRLSDDWLEKEHLHWPVTKSGQRQFLEDVISLVRDLPNGKGIGVCYWHPESIPLGNRKVWKSGSCALFDPSGNLLPAVEVFGLEGKVPTQKN